MGDIAPKNRRPIFEVVAKEYVGLVGVLRMSVAPVLFWVTKVLAGSKVMLI